MLTHSTTQEENALEIHMCERLSKAEKVPTSKDMTLVLVRLLLSSEEGIKKMHEELIKASWEYKALFERAKSYLTVEFELSGLIAAFFGSIYTAPGIGNAIMHIYYIQYVCKQKGIKKFTVKTFCEAVFPFGVFRAEDLSEAWDACKVSREGGSDNLIDYPEASKSIQF